MIDFTSPGGPWVHEVEQATVNQLLAPIESADGMVTRFDGRRMRTLDALFQEYVREFMLPEYFGWNWPAFDECMTDLEWMPAKRYLTIVDHAGEVLKEDLGELPTYLRQMEDIGRHWSRAFALGPDWGGGEVPYHTVLVRAD
ncbi:barstar family protein [Kribbella soli]|uniref:Barstar (barnase inhibitor) domain-containing protein n=1 Tax=Kribbella soli TaxID=1124743 RepID=A0A4R0HLG7_9ACTN|nr:barstar family protein [Kribbella soli]TCC08599.1 hypothetical protein E0H45_22305 [Kribbella soli]